MKLIDVLRTECILPAAELGEKKEALQAVAQLAKQSPLLANVTEANLLKALEEREALGSTGFGKGIAIPHCRVEGAEDFVVGIISTPDGVEFDALDQQPARIIVFIIAPEGKAKQHLRLLSAISHALMPEGALEEILHEKTAIAVRESFLRFSRSDLDTKDRKTKNLLHIFVQDEHTFRDILELLTQMETSSLVVLDVENTAHYLARIPLFSDFLRDESAGFCRVIMAVVERQLSNETLQRIESITGNLDDITGVMVTVQELFFAAGSLVPE